MQYVPENCVGSLAVAELGGGGGGGVLEPGGGFENAVAVGIGKDCGAGIDDFNPFCLRA